MVTGIGNRILLFNTPERSYITCRYLTEIEGAHSFPELKRSCAQWTTCTLLICHNVFFRTAFDQNSIKSLKKLPCTEPSPLCCTSYQLLSSSSCIITYTVMMPKYFDKGFAALSQYISSLRKTQASLLAEHQFTTFCMSMHHRTRTVAK